MIHELDWKNLEDRRKDIILTVLYTIINEIGNVPNNEIIILADTRTRSKHGLTFRNNNNQCKYSFFSRTIY